MMYPRNLLTAVVFAFAILLHTNAETWTDDVCPSHTASMFACAQRWDSVRQDCTSKVTSNTVWPGPCECSYYSLDMACFDEYALCANQVWTQAPDWFREGAISCYEKNSSYTIRAQLGPVSNPWYATTLSRSTSGGAIPSQTGAGIPSATGNNTAITGSRGLSTGAKIGIGIGSVSGIILIAGVVGIYLFLRRRRLAGQKELKDTPETPDAELPFDQIIHEKGDAIYEADYVTAKHELEGERGVEMEGERGVEMEGERGVEMEGERGIEMPGGMGVEADGNQIHEAPCPDIESLPRFQVQIIPPTPMTPRPHERTDGSTE